MEKAKRITLTHRKTLAYTRSYTGWSRGDFRGLVSDEKDVSAEGAASKETSRFSAENVKSGRPSDSEE